MSVAVGRLSVVSCQLSVAVGRLSVVSCQLPVGRLSVVSCRLSVAGCQLSVAALCGFSPPARDRGLAAGFGKARKCPAGVSVSFPEEREAPLQKRNPGAGGTASSPEPPAGIAFRWVADTFSSENVKPPMPGSSPARGGAALPTPTKQTALCRDPGGISRPSTCDLLPQGGLGGSLLETQRRVSTSARLPRAIAKWFRKLGT